VLKWSVRPRVGAFLLAEVTLGDFGQPWARPFPADEAWYFIRPTSGHGLSKQATGVLRRPTREL